MWKCFRKESIRFEVKDNVVSVYGFPELDGRKGIMEGDDMAYFGTGKAEYVANIKTGKIRQFSSGESLLVEDKDIDMEAIVKYCCHGVHNARNKAVRYARINRWDGFKHGLCAISWMLYPDGRYFADSDGFGMEDNDEEEVYAIINTELDIIEPFRPIKDVPAYLKEIRQHK